MSISIVLFALIFFTGTVHPSEKWVFIRGDNGINVYYDEQSVLYNKTFNTYTVNFKYEYLNPEAFDSNKSLTSQYLTFIHDCSSNHSQLLSIKNVYSDSTYEYVNPSKWSNYFTSDSPQEKVFESLCK